MMREKKLRVRFSIDDQSYGSESPSPDITNDC